MKRLLALILAALMLFGAASAFAADYPIEEKFYRQMLESAYRGTITFSVSGTQTQAIPPATFLMLKSLAPRLTLEGDHSFMRGDGQATLRLMLDGQSAGETSFLYNDSLMGIASDLLAGQGVYYTAAQGWDAAKLLSALQSDSAWPALWPALLLGQSAPQAWHEKLQEHLISYETKLGVWMNGYAELSSGVEDGVGYSQLQCTIPAQALKAQIKQLLIDFYEDQELLTHLKEVLTAQQAAAYLQPAMQEIFFSLLDQLPMEGNIEIIRRYDTYGKALIDSISLPFPEGHAMKNLTISVTPEETEQKWSFVGQLQDGTDFDISCIPSEEMIYTGSFNLVLPEKAEDDSFVVEEAAIARQIIAFDYNLIWEPGEEIYTLATDRCTRTLQGSLVIKPREGYDAPTQSLSLTVDFASGSSQRSATQLNATLVWRDLDSDASITAALSSKTAAPFAVSSLDNVNGAMRIDLMEAQGHKALMEYWSQRANAWLEELLPRLMPALFTVSPNL
ncbi:MAG: hypothetical protein E7329_05490 [Clostridiales bacterium]|nr:hypothetical protein [Clostridiales bacterium]